MNDTPDMPIPEMPESAGNFQSRRAGRGGAVWGCLLVALAGCSGADRPGRVPVSGTVTFAGGPPPAEGVVYFSPLAANDGVARRPGRGAFGTDGAFEVGSFETADGLVPGEYRVRVECWKNHSGYTDQPSESYLPEGFQAENLSVPEDESAVVYNVDVPQQP